MNMEKNEVIDRIGYFRVRAKMTQRALSYAIGMNPNYINRLESKRDFLPSLEVLMRIIEACDLTEEEFFYHEIEKYKSDKENLKKYDELENGTKKFLQEGDEDLLRLFALVNQKIFSESAKKR